jgi:hypothetical protein
VICILTGGPQIGDGNDHNFCTAQKLACKGASRGVGEVLQDLEAGDHRCPLAQFEVHPIRHVSLNAGILSTATRIDRNAPGEAPEGDHRRFVAADINQNPPGSRFLETAPHDLVIAEMPARRPVAIPARFPAGCGRHDSSGIDRWFSQRLLSLQARSTRHGDRRAGAESGRLGRLEDRGSPGSGLGIAP